MRPCEAVMRLTHASSSLCSFVGLHATTASITGAEGFLPLSMTVLSIRLSKEQTNLPKRKGPC